MVATRSRSRSISRSRSFDSRDRKHHSSSHKKAKKMRHRSRSPDSPYQPYTAPVEKHKKVSVEICVGVCCTVNIIMPFLCILSHILSFCFIYEARFEMRLQGKNVLLLLCTHDVFPVFRRFHRKKLLLIKILTLIFIVL